MTYDNELTLIGMIYPKDENGNPQTDEVGNQIGEEIKSVVLCGVKSIGRSEFYNAATSGLKPEIIFVVHGYEYFGETQVEYEGTKYKVIRTYSANFEEVELICEKVAANG